MSRNFMPQLKELSLKVGISISALCVGGCMIGPDYVRPSSALPQSYREVSQEWKQADPRDFSPRGNWWEIYNDPLLNELMLKVRVNNQNIIAAEAQYRQAIALVDSAQAGLFPSIGLNVGQSKGSAINSNFSSVGVGASWMPDFWGGVRRSVEASKSNAQASAASL